MSSHPLNRKENKSPTSHSEMFCFRWEFFPAVLRRRNDTTSSRVRSFDQGSWFSSQQGQRCIYRWNCRLIERHLSRPGINHRHMGGIFLLCQMVQIVCLSSEQKNGLLDQMSIETSWEYHSRHDDIQAKTHHEWSSEKVFSHLIDCWRIEAGEREDSLAVLILKEIGRWKREAKGNWPSLSVSSNSEEERKRRTAVYHEQEKTVKNTFLYHRLWSRRRKTAFYFSLLSMNFHRATHHSLAHFFS